MSRSKFAMYAMESEDAIDENMDTDETIEDDEADPSEADNSDTDADDSTSDDTEEEEVDPADEPIIFPEVGNLNVDQVAEVLEEEDTRKEVTDDAIEENRTLTAAVEAMHEQVHINGTLSVAMLNLSECIFKGAQMRLGAPEKMCKSFALEGFEERYSKRATVKNRTQVALEGFGDIIKGVWEAVIKAIQRAIDWVRNLFSGFFKAAARSKKVTQDTMTAILKIRATSRYEAYQNNTSIDEGHYVTLSPDKYKYLSIEGKNPNEVKIQDWLDAVKGDPTTGKLSEPKTADYLEHFDRLLTLGKTHEKYPEYFGKGFIEVVKGIAKNVLDKKDLSQLPPFGAYAPIISPHRIPLMWGSTFKDKTPSAADRCYVVNQAYLGDLVIFNEIGLKPQNNYADSIQELINWKCQVLTEANSSSSNGMPFMRTEELKACNAKIIELNNVLDKFDHTIDQMTHFQGQLKGFAQEMVADSVRLLKETADQSASPKGRSQIFLDLSKMINNLVSNLNTMLVKVAMHLGQVCSAWNAYLKQVLAKEKQVVAQ